MKPLVLNNLTYGMYAIGVKDSNRPSACIANAVVQISSKTPYLLTISLNKENHSCKCIKENGVFTISVLSEDTPGTIIGALGFHSGKHVDKLQNVRHKVLNEGVPVIKENTCCWFLCEVQSSLETDDEEIFVAKIVAGSDESLGKPMTYEFYREALKGTSPRRSPTYLPPEATFDKNSGESFVCSVCGYVYHDLNFGFEELASDWVCPVCKMPKKAYVRKK